MIPILFEYNETDFTTHGLGDLVDCTECKAKATSEGEYELSFTYPVTGELYTELQIGRIVLAKPNDYDRPQQFRIYGIESGLRMSVIVNCQHISYDMASYPIKIIKDQLSPAQAISTMLNGNIVPIDSEGTEAFPFSISGYQIQGFNSNVRYSRGEYVIEGGYTWQAIEDIAPGNAFNSEQWISLEKYEIDSPTNVRAALLDGDNSVLGLYGGDIIFDNKTVRIEKNAGQDRGVIIEYGVDLVDFTQDRNISEMVTGVLPFWKGSVRGSKSGTTKKRYEVYTGDQFEKGYTYYTRKPTYTVTSDTNFNIEKTYYVKSGDDYYGIALDDLDFNPSLDYYEAVGFDYIQSYDTIPKSDKIYYVLENETYRQTNANDLDFNPENTYFERRDESYVETADEHYQWDKEYYIKSIAGESGTTTDEYLLVNTYDLMFKNGLIIYTRSATGYEKTEDEHYTRGKTYYLATPNLGSFIPVDFVNLVFRSDKTYYEETGFKYTVATKYSPGTVYYVSEEIGDTETVVYGKIQYADGFETLPAGAQKIEPLDLSQYFEAEKESQLPSAERLEKKAKQYILANDIGIPAIDLTVQYAALKQDVRMYDSVTVRFPKIGISTTAKVSSYTYDVLKEICTEIEVKNAKASSLWTTLEDASRLRKGLLSPSRIGKKSITGSQISSGTISGSNISSGGIESTNIAPQAITETKIADNSISYNKIIDGAVISSKISDGAVKGQHILDQAISLKKLDKELQVFYSDIIAALHIYADRAVINRYVESSGFIGDIYLVKVGNALYSMTEHTHYMTADAFGNVKAGKADFTGKPHPAQVKAVFGA